MELFHIFSLTIVPKLVSVNVSNETDYDQVNYFFSSSLESQNKYSLSAENSYSGPPPPAHPTDSGVEGGVVYRLCVRVCLGAHSSEAA